MLLVAAALLFGCAPSSETVSPVPAAPQRAESPARASILVGKVNRVIDGDTIVVTDRTKHAYQIHLKGIDAPERGQAFATESTRSLVRLVNGREVIVEWTKVDQRNRLVGRVLLDKRDVCLQQIRAGMARHSMESEESVSERELYDRYQNEARFARRGLWADSAPVEPSVVRYPQRKTPVEPYVPPSSPVTTSRATQDEGIRGNRRSMIYHWPGCPNYDDIAEHNRVPFNSRAEAEQAGYRAARNCH